MAEQMLSPEALRAIQERTLESVAYSTRNWDEAGTELVKDFNQCREDRNALMAEIERLMRGEFICSSCHLRKDGEGDDGGF